MCLSQFILQVDVSQVPRAPVAAGMGSDVDEAERCSSSVESGKYPSQVVHYSKH